MSDNGETPRRLVSADYIRMQHEVAMAQAERHAEPSVTVECDDTAKGDTSPTVKVWAPLGCDYDALTDHALKVAEIAAKAHKQVQGEFPRVS